MLKRDGANKSLWQDVNHFSASRDTNLNEEFDVIIIGGGITGLSAALKLQLAGKKCVVAEAYNLGYGTTGGTTAHLNTFMDEPYYKIKKNFGEQNALLIAEGAKQCIRDIQQNIQHFQIDCDFGHRNAYLYAIKEQQVALLEDIVQSGRDCGIKIDYVNETPFPVPYLKIAQVQQQAQFHPVKYIHGLARAFEAAGGTILENCRVNELNDNNGILEANTEKGMLKAEYAVYATHIPPGVNMIHFRCAPYRSYAMAFRYNNKTDGGSLGYDLCDPYHYFRTHTINGETYLIAGGEDHKTGHEKFTNAPFRRLESYVKSYFEVGEVAYKWSSQYYESVDGLPFIGHLPGNPKNVFVATAFGGNGMIYGTMSAQVITDLIIQGDSPYKELFNPARIKPIAGLHNFIKENADVVKEFISGKFSASQIKELLDIAPGEGRLVTLEDTKIALYKDERHCVHAVNPTCTHVKCTVGWNETEQSWDCPCHGARFSVDGKILNGPAGKDLKQINLSEKENKE